MLYSNGEYKKMSLMSSQHNNHEEVNTDLGFMEEPSIWPALEGFQRNANSKTSLYPEIEKWCIPKEHSQHDPRLYHHLEKIGKPDGFYDCNTIVDEWYKWFLITPRALNPHTNPGNPYSTSNTFLLERNDTKVYFTTASPFREPSDFKTVTITEKAALLVPIYNVSTSTQFFPSLDDDKKLTELIFKDLSGVYALQASFDGEPIIGCSVIRNQSAEFPIADQDNVVEVPDERLNRPLSTVKMCHGGFWLLIKEETLTPGEHLLKFTAKSRNYEIDAKILIIVLR